MGAILAFFGNPPTAAVLVGIILLIVGFVALALGNVPIFLGALGFAALIFTAAELSIWKITVPAGIALIVLAAAWGTISLAFH